MSGGGNACGGEGGGINNDQQSCTCYDTDGIHV